MRLRLQQQLSTFGGIIDSPRYPRCFFNVFDNDDPFPGSGLRLQMFASSSLWELRTLLDQQRSPKIILTCITLVLGNQQIPNRIWCEVIFHCRSREAFLFRCHGFSQGKPRERWYVHLRIWISARGFRWLLFCRNQCATEPVTGCHGFEVSFWFSQTKTSRLLNAIPGLPVQLLACQLKVYLLCFHTHLSGLNRKAHHPSP